MTYKPHTPVKPEHLAATAVGLVSRELVVPKLFTREGIEDFKGVKDDTLNMTVPGVLPAHDYEWRNDRSQPIKVDEYTERKVSLRFGGNAYSAVQLTDEQREMDFDGWSKLLAAQSRAVVKHLEYGAVKKLTTADYGVTLGMKENSILHSVVEARRVLNHLSASRAGRFLLVGSDVDSILQLDPTFNRADSAGDIDASSALKGAIIGHVKGFTVVSSSDIPGDEAYALTPGAFGMLNAAPSVPSSIKEGAIASADGISLRWLKDYDPSYMIERSVVNTWYGFTQVKDPIVYWDEGKGHEVVSEGEHFIRGIKLKIDATDSYFASAGGDANALKKLIGVTANKRPKATTAPAVAGIGG